MAAVMIGVDPHKGSRTAAAIDVAEAPLGELRVRSGTAQAGRLTEWAAAWPERTWAVEGAGGLGHLLAQQLIAAGEQVLDVQPKLGARVRLLSSGTPDKNDPNDARSVAVAALRSSVRHEVRADDHAVVLRVWSRRHRQLARIRTQPACRLHAVPCEITPGGVPRAITVARAAAIPGACPPAGPVAAAWHELAAGHLADLRRIDAQMREVRTKITVAVRASGTTLTEVFGVGPVIAATVIGDVGDASRFATGDRFAACNGTAPIEVSSGNRKICRLSRRGNRHLNHGVHIAAVTQIRHQHSDGRAYYDKKTRRGQDTPRDAPRAQAQDQQRHLRPPAAPTPDEPPDQRSGPGRATGERLCLQRGRLTPRTPALRTSHSRARHQPTPAHPPQRRVAGEGTPPRHLTNKRDSIWAASWLESKSSAG